MKIQSLWIQHDLNAHSDPKMRALQHLGGYAAKGMFWDLVEQIGIAGGFLRIDEVLAISMGLELEELEKNIGFMVRVGLLEKLDDGTVRSDAIDRRLQVVRSLSEKNRKIAQERELNRVRERQVNESSPDVAKAQPELSPSPSLSLLSKVTSKEEDRSGSAGEPVNFEEPDIEPEGFNDPKLMNPPALVTPKPPKPVDPASVRVKMAPRIFMSEKEYRTLEKEFTREIARYYIKVCSDYLEANGKTKKNSAAFVRNWIRSEKAERRGLYSVDRASLPRPKPEPTRGPDYWEQFKTPEVA